MNIRLCTNVIKKNFFTYYKVNTTEEWIFNDDGNLFQSELPLNWIHFCPKDVLGPQICKPWLNLVL